MSAKVIPFTGVSKLDTPVDRILEQCKGKMNGCIVIGFDNNDEFYAVSSYADGGTVLWLIEVCKKLLLEVGKD